MSVAEVAKILDLSPKSVYELAKAKRIDHYRTGPSNGKILFDQDQVNRYLDSCRVTVAVPTPDQAPVSPRRSPNPSPVVQGTDHLARFRAATRPRRPAREA